MIGFTELGLLFIGASWLIQAVEVKKKDTRLNKQFVLIYVLGVILVLIGGLINGTVITNMLNLLALFGSLIVFFRMVDTPDLYLKSADEMIASFKELPEAIETSVKIAEKVNIEIPLGIPMFPIFEVPGKKRSDGIFKRVNL